MVKNKYINLRILNIRKATDEEWDYIWQQCDYSTYFHSRQWSEIWSEYTESEMVPDPQMIIFSDGKCALVPFSAQKGFLKTFFSSPAGTYGGWISTHVLNAEHTQLLSEYMIHLKGAIFWRLNPYYPHYNQMRVRSYRKDETHSLNLENEFTAIVNLSTKGHKSAANKARREGVTSRLACTTLDWEAYFSLYLDSLDRWGDKATSRYSWRLFEILSHFDSDKVKLWLAEYQGHIIAGTLCFYARKHVVYWHGAASGDFFYLRPVHLLVYNAVKNARESGATWFDFNPSGGHEGVIKFKRGFGTKTLPSDTIVKYTVRTYLVKEAKKCLYRIQKVYKILSQPN